MRQEPLISVVIPVYNGSDYLREAIDSVLNQTYSNIEIIVVNDGSSDHGQTERIALSYGERIRYISKENGGVATALNAGISQMKGEYFSWLSHDDVFYPNKLQKQIQTLEGEGVRITACSYDFFYNSGRKVPVPIVDFYGLEILQNSVFSILHGLIQFGGVLFKRELFDDYGIFREDLRTTQDYEFLFRVLRKELCVYSNEILYGIRCHDNQGSNTISCVNSERDEMYQMFMQELTEEEKVNMHGNCRNFYYQMLLRVWPMPEIHRSIKFCMNELSMEEGQKNQREINQVLPILIYGAGAYGRRLLFDLRCRGVRVAGFLDGNSRLRGHMIDGVRCYTLDDLKNGNITGTIIIASILREEIAATLKENGISTFYFKEEWDRRMSKTAPEWKKIEAVVAEYNMEI